MGRRDCAYGPRAAIDERTLRVLDFFPVLEALAGRTVTPMGRDLALALRPLTDPAAVRAALDETAEAVAVAADGEIPVRGARDLGPLADRAAVGGVPARVGERREDTAVDHIASGHVLGRTRTPNAA